MKLKITLDSNINQKYEFEHECRDNITSKEFFEEIHNKFFKDYNDVNINDEYIPCFSFVKNDTNQKPIGTFNLLEFLENFDYDLYDLQVFYKYGVGGGFDFDGIAKICVNANEPHKEPHVHIYPGKASEDYVRIAIKTRTQMKGDSKKFEDLFKNKERKKIKEFLRENKDKLIDFYNRTTKGEYITEEYILYYDGKQYELYTSRIY